MYTHGKTISLPPGATGWTSYYPVKMRGHLQEVLILLEAQCCPTELAHIVRRCLGDMKLLPKMHMMRVVTCSTCSTKLTGKSFSSLFLKQVTNERYICLALTSVRPASGAGCMCSALFPNTVMPKASLCRRQRHRSLVYC